MQTIVGREFQKLNVASLQCRVGLTFTSMLDSQRFWKNWAVRTYIEMDFLIHLPDKVQLWPWMLKTLEQNGTQSSARYWAREEERGGREEAGGSTWSTVVTPGVQTAPCWKRVPGQHCQSVWCFLCIVGSFGRNLPWHAQLLPEQFSHVQNQIHRVTRGKVLLNTFIRIF